MILHGEERVRMEQLVETQYSNNSRVDNLAPPIYLVAQTGRAPLLENRISLPLSHGCTLLPIYMGERSKTLFFNNFWMAHFAPSIRFGPNCPN